MRSYKLVNETKKTDLSHNIQKNYSIRGHTHDFIPEPRISIVASLYEVALQSYLPTFVSSGFQGEGLPKHIYDSLLGLVPLDLPLDDLVHIDNEQFWHRKLLADYAINSKMNQSGEKAINTYFTRFATNILEGRLDNVPYWFAGERTVEEQMNRLFSIGTISVDSLCLELTPDFPYYDLIRQLNLHSLTITYNTKTSQDNTVEAAEQQTHSIQSKTLQEIAAMGAEDTYDSVFPFHKFYNVEAAQTMRGPDNTCTRQLYYMSQQCYISNKDIVGLQEVLHGTQNQPSQLRMLRIANSGLNNQQLQPLTVIVAGSRLQALELPNNFANDLGELVKLFVKQDGRINLKHVNLSRNFIQENGAAQIMKALQQQECALEELLLGGNSLQGGFLLVLNGVLGASIKFGNKSLRVLDISECQIQFKHEHTEVLQRVFEQTGVKFLNISGNNFNDMDLQAIQTVAVQNGAVLLSRGGPE